MPPRPSALRTSLPRQPAHLRAGINPLVRPGMLLLQVRLGLRRMGGGWREHCCGAQSRTGSRLSLELELGLARDAEHLDLEEEACMRQHQHQHNARARGRTPSDACCHAQHRAAAAPHPPAVRPTHRTDLCPKHPPCSYSHFVCVGGGQLHEGLLVEGVGVRTGGRARVRVRVQHCHCRYWHRCPGQLTLQYCSTAAGIRALGIARPRAHRRWREFPRQGSLPRRSPRAQGCRACASRRVSYPGSPARRRAHGWRGLTARIAWSRSRAHLASWRRHCH